MTSREDNDVCGHAVEHAVDVNEVKDDVVDDVNFVADGDEFRRIRARDVDVMILSSWLPGLRRMTSPSTWHMTTGDFPVGVTWRTVTQSTRTRPATTQTVLTMTKARDLRTGLQAKRSSRTRLARFTTPDDDDEEDDDEDNDQGELVVVAVVIIVRAIIGRKL